MSPPVLLFSFFFFLSLLPFINFFLSFFFLSFLYSFLHFCVLFGHFDLKLSLYLPSPCCLLKLFFFFLIPLLPVINFFLTFFSFFFSRLLLIHFFIFVLFLCYFFHYLPLFSFSSFLSLSFSFLVFSFFFWYFFFFTYFHVVFSLILFFFILVLLPFLLLPLLFLNIFSFIVLFLLPNFLILLPLFVFLFLTIHFLIFSNFYFVSFFIFLPSFLFLLLLLFLLIYSLEFSTSVLAMVFHWSLSDSKSPQVSRTLLSILTTLNNAVVWMVSIHPSTSRSSSPFNNPLVTVPKAPITIGIIVTFMFHSFFNPQARSRYLSFFSHSFSFILWSVRTAKSTILQILFFLLIIIRSSLLVEIRWSICM